MSRATRDGSDTGAGTLVSAVRSGPADRDGAPARDGLGAVRRQLLVGRTVVLLAATGLAVLAALAGPGPLRLALTLGVAGLLAHVNRLQGASTRQRPGPRSPTSTHRHAEEP